MRSKKFRYMTLGLLFTVVGLALALVPALYAQDRPVLSLAVPEFMKSLFSADLLADFEAQYGAKVNLIGNDSSVLGGESSTNLNDHLDALQEYVSSADVLFITSSSLSPEAARAGLFLDLSPLTSVDAALNPDDFLPAVWQSFQWDGGVWALPVSADVTLLVYDQAAFDEAGLAYPNENWTLDDLANAARALAQYDSSGKVTQPGLFNFSGSTAGMLLYSLTGGAYYDSTVIPNAPSFANTAIDSLLTTWAALEKEGIVSSSFTGNFLELPMRLVGNFGFGTTDPNSPPPGISLLPGGKAGLEAQGFAVSSGTQSPELAYALAQFLTTRPEIAQNFFGATPARQSMIGVEAPPPDEGGGFIIIGGGPQNQAAIDLALANAIPASELRFATYLTVALDKMKSDNLDARAALQEAEAQAVSNFNAAGDRRATTVVAVATPVPTPVLAAGEVSLKFGLSSFIQPLPNREDWDRVIGEFTAIDPQVRQIELDTQFIDPASYPESHDCWYLPYNNVPDADLNGILNLDPFLDADFTFDKSDVIGGVLSQLQRDNKTWALPMVIQPQALSYDSQQFAQAGLSDPASGWTIENFNDALTALKFSTGEDAPFSPRTPGGTYLLLLIAAYGGLPLDYRTTPPTINFTETTNADAIRQVLDLAKTGYLDYQELSAANVIVINSSGDVEVQPPIYSTGLTPFDFRITLGGDQSEDTYRLANYPRGSQYSATTYSLSTAYISARTPNAEACYRWLSHLSRHPELFSGMPARRSLLSDPAVTANQTPDEISFYQAYDALLQDPNTITFPSAFAGASPANFLLEQWLNRAFDNYVLRDADLDSELAQAQQYASSFMQCTADIPPYDPAASDQQAYFSAFTKCAVTVDPSLSGLFQGGQ